MENGGQPHANTHYILYISIHHTHSSIHTHTHATCTLRYNIVVLLCDVISFHHSTSSSSFKLRLMRFFFIVSFGAIYIFSALRRSGSWLTGWLCRPYGTTAHCCFMQPKTNQSHERITNGTMIQWGASRHLAFNVLYMDFDYNDTYYLVHMVAAWTWTYARCVWLDVWSTTALFFFFSSYFCSPKWRENASKTLT